MSDEFTEDLHDDADSSSCEAVPTNFPRAPTLAAIGGAQPKVLLSQYEGKFFEAGVTPPELLARWRVCEDLAQQLSVKSLESKAGKRAHMSEREILEQYLTRLITTKWVSEIEARWIINRVAEILNWAAPFSPTL